MSTRQGLSLSANPPARWRWLLAYLAVYGIASAMDLGSTALALRQSGAAEANMFATDDGIYSAVKALALTLFGALGMGGMFAFGIHYADRVAERWLRSPMRSFAAFYINPWAPRAIERSPLHMTSYAIAFALLRVLAAANNMIIVAGGAGPLGLAVREVGRATTPVAGFAIAIGGVYLLLTVLVAPFAGWLIRRIRRGGALPMT